MDEWLDIYDEHQRPTGRLRRRGDPIEPGERYLVVTVFVRDSGGRFLTTRRSPPKSLLSRLLGSDLRHRPSQGGWIGRRRAGTGRGDRPGPRPSRLSLSWAAGVSHRRPGRHFYSGPLSCAAAFGRTGHPDAAGGGGGLVLAHPGRGGAAVPHHPHGAADPLWLAGIPGNSAPRAAGPFRTEPIRRLFFIISFNT